MSSLNAWQRVVNHRSRRMIVCEKRMRVCLRRFVNLWQSMSATNEWYQIQEDGRGESEPGKNPWVGGGGAKSRPLWYIEVVSDEGRHTFPDFGTMPRRRAVPTSLGWYYNQIGYGMIQYGYKCVKIQETWTRRNRTYFDVHYPWFRVVASFDWDWYPIVSPSLSKMLCMGHSSISQMLDGSNMYLWLYRDVMYHWQCNISTYVM